MNEPRRPLPLVHVVRNYGPVGGAERYVFALTREQRALGHAVTVVCERSFAPALDGIAVHELGATLQKPRWLCQVRFRGRVRRWLARHRPAGSLVHSHERLHSHDVSTYHGPPFAPILERPWWRRLSLRIAMQLDLERQELATARVIVPNSPLIGRELARYYPQHRAKIAGAIVPGVDPTLPRDLRRPPADGGVIGFVGREWRRKGLPLAAAIVESLRARRPNLELWVVGADPDEIRPLFSRWQGGYRLLGWRDNRDDMLAFDVLLHPAKAEPYGMVITEAMAARVPVVVSDACGAAAQVGADAGCVVPLQAPLLSWVEALERQLTRPTPPLPFVRSWADVARDYDGVYRALSGG